MYVWENYRRHVPIQSGKENLSCVFLVPHKLTPMGVTTISGAMAALRERCNGTGEPDFSGLQIGDYLDGLDLSAIPAERDGTAGQVWSDGYKNNRITLSAFNPYKGVGDTEVAQNHVRFDFANVPLRGRMNAGNDNTGGYPASEMRAFLEGVNGDGTGGKSGVTTAAFLNALKAQIGDYILPVRRLLSNKVIWAWVTCSLWLPSEDEVFGESAWGESGYGDGQKLHIPLYRDSYLYRIKRNNGSRDWWWLSSPSAGSAVYFCHVAGYGHAHTNMRLGWVAAPPLSVSRSDTDNLASLPLVGREEDGAFWVKSRGPSLTAAKRRSKKI
jgi:hypothetical protein